MECGMNLKCRRQGPGKRPIRFCSFFDSWYMMLENPEGQPLISLEGEKGMAKGTVNKVILVGRLGADPDIRYSANGVAVAKFNLATNDYVSGGGEGNREERTEWHRIVTFGKTAEFCGNYLSKGRQVYVEGSIRTNQWDDAQGQKRYSTEIIAREIQLLGSAEGQGQGQAPGPGGGQGQMRNAGGGRSSVEELPPSTGGPPDDDIPF